MAIKESNQTVQGVVTQDVKDKLQKIAAKNYRSVSKQIALIIEQYVASFDDDGNPLPISKTSPTNTE